MRNYALASLMETFLAQAKEAKLAVVLHFQGTVYGPLFTAKIAALEQISAGLLGVMEGGSSKAARDGFDALVKALEDIIVAGPPHLSDVLYAERAGAIALKMRLIEMDVIIAESPESVMLMDASTAGSKSYRN